MYTPVEIQIMRMPSGTDLPMPRAMTAGSAGCDLCAAIPAPVILQPLQRKLIPTGFAIAIPPGYEAQIRPRSGLAIKHGITLINSPGTIDSDYRGEIFCPLINLSDQPFAIERGMRIAQLIIAAFATPVWTEVPTLDSTLRGTGGFGHTGH
ncbi:MAG TPA: dUTP diphosphatase [Tepidisphaeraceae bacterium]|jgi:dUTP pyrophosphatase